MILPEFLSTHKIPERKYLSDLTGQIPYLTNTLLNKTLSDKYLTRQIPYRANTLSDKYLTGQIPYRTNTLPDKYLTGQIPYRTNTLPDKYLHSDYAGKYMQHQILG